MTTVKNVLLKDAAGNYLIPYPSNAFDSRITTLENGTEKLSNKNVPNGYVGLGSDGMISRSFYDTVNVGFKTFMTSNAENPPSASWKALGSVIYKSSYPDFYNDANNMYQNGSYYSVNYSSYATYSTYSKCFLIDWLDDSHTCTQVDTNKYQFDTDIFTATVYYPSGGTTTSTYLNVLKYFLGKWITSFNTTDSYRNTIGSMTITGSLEIELVLKEPYRSSYEIKRFSRYLSGNYSSSNTYYTVQCDVFTTTNGTTWTSAYSKSSQTHWDAVITGSFIGIKLVSSGTRYELGYYTWDEADTPSIGRTSRYYYKAKTISIVPKTSSPTILNNVIKTKNNFMFIKDYSYDDTIEAPSSNFSKWIINGCYDFTNLFNTLYKINTSSQTVTLPLSASYNYVCADNSDLNLLEFYQDVITNYQKRDNSNNLKPYVVSHTQSSRYFCRIWSNNFCEQWGVVTSTGKSGTLTLPQAYASSTSWAMAYCEGFTTGTSTDTEGYDFTCGFTNVTTNTVRYTCANGRTFSWYAAGWIA